MEKKNQYTARYPFDEPFPVTVVYDNGKPIMYSYDEDADSDFNEFSFSQFGDFMLKCLSDTEEEVLARAKAFEPKTNEAKATLRILGNLINDNGWEGQATKMFLKKYDAMGLFNQSVPHNDYYDFVEFSYIEDAISKRILHVSKFKTVRLDDIISAEYLPEQQIYSIKTRYGEELKVKGRVNIFILNPIWG